MGTSDVLIGIVAGVITILLAMLSGGFSFIAPWLLWSSATLLVAGFTRRVERNDILQRVISVNLSWFFVIPFLVQGQLGLVALCTVGNHCSDVYGYLDSKAG